ncbi:hypothetical protein QQF64_026797 [Cirrhinus molitorella]|uniref:Fibronectin type-III domain-containing protein n=1 Tax=Cirrhinus molitorella TaxID=172907 RepID=A0ABR3NB48_9TELE
MDLGGVDAIETAALGRPFQLGMLYDCRNDALIPGITLWDKEQLQQSIQDRSQINTVINITASDSIEEKSRLLDIDSSLKLSLLSGLITVNGAASYLCDTKKSFKQQRLTLHYHSTTKFEELTMNHLASGNKAHYEGFDNDTATHVVTAVLYGADAFFVFDREVASAEDKSTVEGEVKAAHDKLKSISGGTQIDLSLNDKQKTAVQKFSCTFYGDFPLQSNLDTFEDALKGFSDLQKMLRENKELAVPLRVWLYPLDKLKLCAAKLQKDISISLIKNVESVIESLSTTEMKCSDLLKDTPVFVFAEFHNKIKHMKLNCYNYKLSFMKKLGCLLPKIRGDMEKETELIKLLSDHEECPFRGSDLEQWVKEKEQESVRIKTLTQLIDSGVTVEENLAENVMELEVENVVSYTFTLFECPDVLLSKQKVFLSPSTKDNNGEDSPDSKQKTGFTSDINTTMRSNLTILKNLIESKTFKPSTCFVAAKEMKNNSGSCILLYKNGSDKATCFSPPLKPTFPVIEQISGHSVVVKVSPACPATEELRLLYKMKEEKDWKSLSVQSHDTATLTDLSPDTEYEVKYAAVGKLNYTVDSEVIHLRVIHKKLINATESVLETLSLIENKCSELMKHNSAERFDPIHRRIQDMMRYGQTYKQDLSNRIKSMIQSIQNCEKDISALMDLLQDHNESPFNENNLTEWITLKEKELISVDTFLEHLLYSGAEVNNNLDTFLSDMKVKNMVCYTFTSLDIPDNLLSDLEDFLKPSVMTRNSEKKPKAVPQTWLTGSIREKMREHFETFKKMMMLLHSDQSTKFLVISKEETIHPGSCILLYENGSDEGICFTPPSKPACPVIEQISDHNVVVKVSPACPATEELRLLYKMKEEKDWKSQSVQRHDTVTLSELSPDTEYEMKYTAVGKLNYTVDSDVIHLRVIDKKLINATESVLETLSLIENKCSELMKHNSAVTFNAIHRKFQDMMKNCQTYKQDLNNRFNSLKQSIQACEKDISALTDLLQDHNESPFHENNLTEWITLKEKELISVDTFLEHLLDSGAEVNNNLDTFLSDMKVKNMVCYTFSSLDIPDNLLSDLEDFLKPSVMTRNSEKKPKAVPQTWLTGSIRKKMREHLEIFKQMMLLHGDQSTTFLVISKEHTIHPGSCILLYENGSDEGICFTPPSKPACPVIEQISGHNVVVKVSPACPATEELRLLYKMKEEKDWKSQSVQRHDTVTLSELSPDTEYEMKYTAVGKLNYTVDSDVIHLRVIDKKLINATESVLETLSSIEDKCSELMKHNSAVTFNAIHRKFQDMMKNCQTYKQDLNNRFNSLKQSVQVCEKDISALTDLLQAHNESPFNKNNLMNWITIKEEESNSVDTFFQQLRDSGAEVNNDLSTFLSDIKVKNLLCYTFSSLDIPDDLLSDLENFLKPSVKTRNSEKICKAVPQTWLTGSIREKMREHLEIFKQMMLLHGDQSTTFLVISKEHTIHPGSCILLYENGSDEGICFTPPSKPTFPVIEQISGHSVVVKVSPACPATEELRLLYKMKEEKDWKSQSVQSHDTVTLTDLSPDTEYEMKYTAVGKLNYTVDSDVIHLRVIDKKLINATESVLETLSSIEDKCSELMKHNSAVTFNAIHRKF